MITLPTLQIRQQHHVRSGSRVKGPNSVLIHMLTRESWEGARLHDVIEEVLEPYRVSRQARFEVRGPEIQVSPRFALGLSMALHELATDAVKYWALSNGTGQVRLTWLG